MRKSRVFKRMRGATLWALTLTLLAGVATPLQAGEAASDKETLRAVMLLFRHSVISPKHNPPNLKAEWPMGPKQLTAVGMRDMYEVGIALNKKYVEELGFISERYKASELYVRASSTDRALQSAQLVMLGLFPLGTGPDPSVYDKSLEAVPNPELAFTPVPIHSVPLETDAVLRSYSGRADCKRYRKFAKDLYKTELYVAQSRKYEDFLVRMASVTGVAKGEKPQKILHLVNEIYEPVSAFKQHNVALPESISGEDIALLRQLADWNYHHQFIGKAVGQLTGGPFVGELISNFNGFIKAKEDAPKLYLYLGHQRTILGIEAALGLEKARTEGPLFVGRVPPQGSHYAFELHKQGANGYAVRLKFVTDEAEQIVQLPNCGSETCPFDRFLQLYASVVPRNWRSACNG